MKESSVLRGEIWWISLDPTQGSEIKKTRPCVVISHNTLNRIRKTVVVIPLSTAASPQPPITIDIQCQGKQVVAIVDQIRAVAKQRLQSKIETISAPDLKRILQALSKILEIT